MALSGSLIEHGLKVFCRQNSLNWQRLFRFRTIDPKIDFETIYVVKVLRIGSESINYQRSNFLD